MKRQNKLYSNPENVKSHPFGSNVVIGQPIVFNDKKIMTEAVCYIENMFLNFALSHQKDASKAMIKVKKIIGKQSGNNLPYVDSQHGKNELLHHGFSVVIYSYCAIESYFNALVERYCTISEQKDILKDRNLQKKLFLFSRRFGIDNISNSNSVARGSFLEMEKMRDEILHCRMDYFFEDGTDWSRLLVSKIFNNKFKDCVETAVNIIDYYKKNEPQNNSNKLNIIATGLQENPL